MSYKLYKEKLEVAHHAGKALRINVAAAFQGFLTLLTAFRAFKAIEEFLKLIDIKVVVARSDTSSGHVTKRLTTVIIAMLVLGN